MNKSNIFDLTNKVSIVTGAAGGLGRAIALGLAEHGSDIVLTDRTDVDLSKVSQAVERTERQVLIQKADITNVKEVSELVQAAQSKFKKVDILVNNAGCNIRKPALDITEKDWDTVIDVNLKGAFFCTQAVGKLMISQRSGKIINIASVMALVGSPDYQTIVPYCASKGGLAQLTKAFATEWAKDNVQVNAIAPATVETPLVSKMLEDSVVREQVLSRIPLGRLATPEELV
ncbi:MAG: SDR family NAD(P)-dependent oxidoreductase, partial [Actinobacteria bacterium]|nr:SDR family NAD(P)-dependent oxidoreductase [Actinomycetota bacterium]